MSGCHVVRTNQCETRLQFIKKGFNIDFSMAIMGERHWRKQKNDHDALASQHAGSYLIQDKRDGAARHFCPGSYHPICIYLWSAPPPFIVSPAHLFWNWLFSLPHSWLPPPNYMIHLHLLMGHNKSILNIKNPYWIPQCCSATVCPFLTFHPPLNVFSTYKKLLKGVSFKRTSCCVAQGSPKVPFFC